MRSFERGAQGSASLALNVQYVCVFERIYIYSFRNTPENLPPSSSAPTTHGGMTHQHWANEVQLKCTRHTSWSVTSVHPGSPNIYSNISTLSHPASFDSHITHKHTHDLRCRVYYMWRAMRYDCAYI